MNAKIYTTSVCPACNMAKEFLKSKKVEFEILNIENDDNLANEMIEKSGQFSVPVIEIGGKIIVGFNKPAIAAAIERFK
ncbi:MAG TPA: glutaredoxin domain-containing protein [archaeon]|nr:glutaredoxin domain-containing protein [archaeon]